MGSPIQLGPLTDTIAHTVPLERDRQVELLLESDVRRRGEILLAWLKNWSIQPGWPIGYSELVPGEN